MDNMSDIASTFYQYFNTINQAYLEGLVPGEAKLPYMTYSLSYSAEYEDDLIQVKVYDSGTSLKRISDITNKLSNDIGFGKTLKTKNGTLWLKKGEPFAQFIRLENEVAIYINLITNYLGG